MAPSSSERPPSDIADVTVVMPAMNRAHLIGRAIDSAMRQTLPPREVIVVDDGSSDGTADVARRHGARVISNPVNLGSGPARNTAVEAADTTWIAFLDSDDEWLPRHLELLMAGAEGRVLVAAPATRSDGAHMGNPTGVDMELAPRTVLCLSDLVITSATMVTKDAIVRAGMFRPLRRAQDLDLWLRVLSLGTGVALTTPTVTYLVHDEQASLDSDITRACFDQIVESCADLPWFDGGHDRDRAYVRLHWDDLRARQRGHELRAAGSEAWWLARRPHTWPVMGQILQMRRQRRRVVTASFSASRSPAAGPATGPRGSSS